VNDVRVGAQLGWERLRGASALVVLALVGSTVFAAGVLERRSDPSSAPDDVLAGVAFGLALPLLAYLVSERVCDGQRLDRSVDCVARHGADRRRALLGLLLSSALATALAGALIAALAVLGAHRLRDAALGFDLRSSIGIAFVSGFAYALCFGAASLLGKRGGGRKWALLADFVFGSGASAFAAMWPRSHVRNLLGGEPALDLSQAGAWAALVAIGIACAALSLLSTAE
jgi:hypothetical protein